MHYHVNSSFVTVDGKISHRFGPAYASRDAVSIFEQFIKGAKDAGWDHTDTFYDDDTVMPTAFFRRNSETQMIAIDRKAKQIDRCEVCSSYTAQQDRQHREYQAACNERDARVAAGAY